MLVFSRTSFLVFSQNFDEYKKMKLKGNKTYRSYTDTRMREQYRPAAGSSKRPLDPRVNVRTSRCRDCQSNTDNPVINKPRAGENIRKLKYQSHKRHPIIQLLVKKYFKHKLSYRSHSTCIALNSELYLFPLSLIHTLDVSPPSPHSFSAQ